MKSSPAAGVRASATFATILLALALLLPASPVRGQSSWQAKVDPWVLRTAERDRQTNYLVFLSEQADLSPVHGLRSKDAKGAAVFERLTEVAQRTQAPLLHDLAAAELPHRAFWIANMIWVESDLATLQELARRSDVARIYANPRVAMDSGFTQRRADRAGGAGPEPNLLQIGAPQVFWSAGFTGQGVVLASQDSGYEWTHPALQNQYRGWDGVGADHSYNWHDAIHSGGGSCGADSPVPCDDNGHGTQTLGVLVGDDGAGNQIGMAPGARWIGCRNMDEGVGTPATYAECFQFFLAPTDLNDQNPDPALAPHAVANSWVCPPSEGCTDPEVLRAVVESVRAAGIVVVAAAGNSGSACATVADPPAIYDASITVGSENLFGEVSNFSSRGPVTVDGSNRIKPDLLAPGEDIRSSTPGGGYLSFSGTSMSAPHVAGLAGLMISAVSCLAGDVDAIETFIEETAQGFTSGEQCGGVPGDQFPNNTYGHGFIIATLPSESLCTVGIGGAVSGVDPRRARCVNGTTGQSVQIQLAGELSWDCGAGGLLADPGDRVSQLVFGPATSGPIGGSASGVSVRQVTCLNATTGQNLTIQSTEPSWDCTAAGLLVSPGDRVSQTVRGVAL